MVKICDYEPLKPLLYRLREYSREYRLKPKFSVNKPKNKVNFIFDRKDFFYTLIETLILHIV